MPESKPKTKRYLPDWKWVLKHVVVPLATAMIGAAGAGLVVWIEKDAEVQREKFRNEVDRNAAESVITVITSATAPMPVRGPASVVFPPEPEPEPMMFIPDVPDEPPAEVYENLRHAFPDIPEEQIQEQVQEDWQDVQAEWRKYEHEQVQEQAQEQYQDE